MVASKAIMWGIKSTIFGVFLAHVVAQGSERRLRRQGLDGKSSVVNIPTANDAETDAIFDEVFQADRLMRIMSWSPKITGTTPKPTVVSPGTPNKTPTIHRPSSPFRTTVSPANSNVTPKLPTNVAPTHVSAKKPASSILGPTSIKLKPTKKPANSPSPLTKKPTNIPLKRTGRPTIVLSPTTRMPNLVFPTLTGKPKNVSQPTNVPRPLTGKPSSVPQPLTGKPSIVSPSSIRTPSKTHTSMPIAGPTTVSTSPPVKFNGTVMDVLKSNPNLTNITAAIFAAKLNDTLSTSNSLTFFAPDNSAMANLDETYVSTLISSPGYYLHLQNLVQNHASAQGTYLSSNFVDGQTITMLNGQTMGISKSSVGIFVSTLASQFGFASPVQVTGPDFVSSNGVVHVVKSVLTPLWYYLNLMDLLNVQSDTFSTLVSFIELAGLSAIIAGSNGTTLLAPTNAAFAALPASTVNYLSDPANIDVLRSLLKYHLLPSLINPLLLPVGKNVSIPTSDGQNVSVLVESGANNVAVISYNGVVSQNLFLTKWSLRYQIGQVLVPPNMTLP
jgi:uncharacterized surface protein with fasciclin (FAS1) repeats